MPCDVGLGASGRSRFYTQDPWGNSLELLAYARVGLMTHGPLTPNGPGPPLTRYPRKAEPRSRWRRGPWEMRAGNLGMPCHQLGQWSYGSLVKRIA
jgi:hypothetical protein